jgi:hypothetical protein
MTTVPAAAAATPSAPLQPRYDPLAGEERRDHPEWIRRNTGAWAMPNTGDGTPGQGQEIDPRYRERSYSFRDILESFNPIQHIPIVGQMYREATGTQLHPIARIAVGAATGPIGAASAFANVALENATGRDLAGHLMNAVAPRPDDANGPQLAGGSWIYDRSIGNDPATAPAGDFTANMAAAPAAPATEPQASARAQRRRMPQVAPPPAASAQEARVPAPARQSAPGSAVPRDLLSPAASAQAAADRGPAQAQLAQAQPGAALAQVLEVRGVPASQTAQGRTIQQYFAQAGLRPATDASRPVPMTISAGTGLRSLPAVATPAQGGQPDAPAAGDGNTWFTAAMLHGVERYRAARRDQGNDSPTIDVSE